MHGIFFGAPDAAPAMSSPSHLAAPRIHAQRCSSSRPPLPPIPTPPSPPPPPPASTLDRHRPRAERRSLAPQVSRPRQHDEAVVRAPRLRWARRVRPRRRQEVLAHVCRGHRVRLLLCFLVRRAAASTSAASPPPPCPHLHPLPHPIPRPTLPTLPTLSPSPSPSPSPFLPCGATHAPPHPAPPPKL